MQTLRQEKRARGDCCPTHGSGSRRAVSHGGSQEYFRSDTNVLGFNGCRVVVTIVTAMYGMILQCGLANTTV